MNASEILDAPPVAAPGWSVERTMQLFELPLPELLHRAQCVHRECFDPCEVQLSTLLSIKTGGCPEDCAYCPQSTHHDTGLKPGALLDADTVLAVARRARDAGATRFCMGAAWRAPKPRQLDAVARMVEQVKALGLQTCVTLGMLEPGQAEQLRDAGLDYYNHNLDTSPEFYGRIITTRCYQERLDTLERVRAAGLKVCWHRRHGRIARAACRAAGAVGHARPLPGIGADQSPGARGWNSAGRPGSARSLRVQSFPNQV